MSSLQRKILGSQENVNDSTTREAPDHDSDDQKPPPKAARSAFMCFTDAKRAEIMRRNEVKENDDVLKLVAQIWRRLSDRERAYWDEEARNDKVRYVREKAEYKGVWVIPKRRAKKHPLAPKRPMSAFLKYSQKRRSMVKEQNPDMSNTDVSRLLGEMWRNADVEERVPYIEQEELERSQYNAEIKKWRQEQAKADAANRTSHCAVKPTTEKQQLPQALPSTTDGYYSAGGSEPVTLHSTYGPAKGCDEHMFRPVPVSNTSSRSHFERSSFRTHAHYNTHFHQESYHMPFKHADNEHSRAGSVTTPHQSARSFMATDVPIGMHADFVTSNAPGSRHRAHIQTQGELSAEHINIYSEYKNNDGQRGTKRNKYFSEHSTQSFDYYQYP